MSTSMTANTWWTSFSNCAMIFSTADSRPVCLLFSALVIHVRALVLLDGDVSACCALDIVLCAGAVVIIVGLCIFF